MSNEKSPLETACDFYRGFIIAIIGFLIYRIVSGDGNTFVIVVSCLNACYFSYFLITKKIDPIASLIVNKSPH